MEVAILGAVGLLGYLVSGKEPRKEVADQPLPPHRHAYPFGPGTEVQKVLEADREAMARRWEQSTQPQLTGVVTPNTRPDAGPLPFFSSAKKQHTNDEIKQRRMETFTGALDLRTSQTGTWSRKQEVPAMFKPEMSATALTSGGRSAGTPFGIDQGARYKPSTVQNNVVPTQQLRVGPGVGVGLDVAASGGFHPTLRILPKNVNAYKRHTLPGGVVPGASHVSARPSQPELAQMGPPRFWDQRRRPTAATKAAVSGATERPTQTIGACGGRMTGEEYYGGAGGNTGSYVGVTQATRDRFDNNIAVHETNVTGARAGVGAFAKATLDTTRMEQQQREQQQTYDGMVTGPRTHTAEELYLLPQTNRSLHVTDLSGNPASHVDGGEIRPLDRIDRTLREHLHPESQPGIATPYIRGHSVQATGKWLDRDAKRYSQHLVGWMPPAHQASDVRVPGLVQIKPRLELPDMPSLPTTATPIAMAPPGTSATNYVKLPEENRRLDLTLATEQLQNNPLHLKLNY